MYWTFGYDFSVIGAIVKFTIFYEYITHNYFIYSLLKQFNLYTIYEYFK